MAPHHDVTVVTRSRCRPAIDQKTATLLPPHPHFIYFDAPDRIWFLKWHTLPMRLHYIIWQIGLRWWMRKRLREFDLIHHVTFAQFLMPGFWWFCGRPVILGPLGGGQVSRLAFLRLFGRRIFWELFRTARVLASYLNPAMHLSFLYASKIVVANRETGNRVPGFHRHKLVAMSELGLNPEQIVPWKPRQDCGAVRVIWVSGLQKWKAPSLAVRALHQAISMGAPLHLTMVGDGPERERIRRLISELGMEQHVSLLGTLTHAEVRTAMTEHDFFLFTSIRDTTGSVVAEAMAAGLPVVTFCHQGAAELTTEATALRIEPTTVDRAVADFAEALVKLSRSAELRRQLGEAGLQRAREHYLWEKKVLVMSSLYDEALRAERCDSVRNLQQ